MTNNSKFLYDRISLFLIQLVEESFVTQTLEFLEASGNDEKLTEFEAVTERLEELCNSIMEHQEISAVFEDMSDVKNNIKAMKVISNQIQLPVNIDDLLVLVEFAGYILDNVEDLESDLVDIDPNEFSIIEDIIEDINVNSFFHQNITEFDRSILFFRGSSNLEQLIDGGLTPTLAMLIISLLSESEDLLIKKFLIIKKSTNEMSNIQALSLLKLFIVCSGKKFHSIRKLPPRNMQHYIDKIDHQLNYQQFNESLIILSEYNSRKELLNKYISLYHMVENFMFKYPLVKLNRDRGGDMFSIRDFKDMYKKVDSGESISLETFLKVALKIENDGQSILNKTHAAFSELTNGVMTESDINGVFNTLDVGNKNGPYKFSDLTQSNTKQNFPTILGKLIYVIRNSIVHNKETEFHLSHDTLDDNICKFIEKFLIPQMEDVLFSLLIEHNDVIWYEHQNIKLFA